LAEKIIFNSIAGAKHLAIFKPGTDRRALNAPLGQRRGKAIHINLYRIKAFWLNEQLVSIPLCKPVILSSILGQ
jgi:hypothetical protein